VSNMLAQSSAIRKQSTLTVCRHVGHVNRETFKSQRRALSKASVNTGRLAQRAMRLDFCHILL